MPGLLLQDTLRFVAFGQRRPGVALTSDSIWSAGQVLATLWVLAHQGTVAGLVLAWAVPGVASGLCAASILRVWPSLGQVPAWARRSLPFAWRYLGEVMATVGVFQIALYLVGWMVGLAAAGWLRLAQTLFGPVHVAVSAARAAMLPEMVRSLDRPARLAGLRNITAATLIVFTVLWTAGLMVLPRHVGVVAVGVAWLGVAQILGLVGVQKILDASGAGPFLALRALRQARLTLRVRALSGVATLVALPPLTYTWGVRGALVALAFGSGRRARPGGSAPCVVSASPRTTAGRAPPMRSTAWTWRWRGRHDYHGQGDCPAPARLHRLGVRPGATGDRAGSVVRGPAPRLLPLVVPGPMAPFAAANVRRGRRTTSADQTSSPGHVALEAEPR